MRLVKLLSRGEGIRTLLWTFIKSFQVATSTLSGLQGEEPLQLPKGGAAQGSLPISSWAPCVGGEVMLHRKEHP